MLLPRSTLFLVLPFGIVDRPALVLKVECRLNSESSAHPVRDLTHFSDGSLVVIKPFTCERVRIYQDMIVNVIGINVRCDDRLHIIAEHFSHKCHAYLVCKLWSDILGIGKTHYVVYRLDGAFACFTRRVIIAAPCVLLVNRLHLRVGILGLGHAIQRDRQNSLVGFAGVENVGQSLLDVTVDSHRFTVRQSSATSPFNFSASSAKMLYVSFAFFAI